MIGGPGSPGGLAIRSSTLRKIAGGEGYIPSQTGGGIVEFVTQTNQVLISNLEHREETGTPAIIESIRSGLAFSVKEMVGCDVISELEEEHLDLVRAKLAPYPNIVILGGLDHPKHQKVPVLSFLIKHHRNSDKVYHFNFVAAVLNDFFGIQSRGGCACAGPYGADLLNIDKYRVVEYQRILCPNPVYNRRPGATCPTETSNIEEMQLSSFKPGFTRLSFNYFTKRQDVEFVLDAMIWVSLNAHKVLAGYDYDIKSGNWYFAAENLRKTTTECPAAQFPIGEFKAWPLNTLAPASKQECFQEADEFLLMLQCVETKACSSVIQPCEIKEKVRKNKKLLDLQWFVDHSTN